VSLSLNQPIFKLGPCRLLVQLMDRSFQFAARNSPHGLIWWREIPPASGGFLTFENFHINGWE
jgi:hypothetical protein